MILLSLGIVIGVLLSIVFLIVALRRSEKIIRSLEKAGESILPSQKAEFIPVLGIEDEATNEIIRENDKKGLDTRLEELNER